MGGDPGGVMTEVTDITTATETLHELEDKKHGYLTNCPAYQFLELEGSEGVWVIDPDSILVSDEIMAGEQFAAEPVAEEETISEWMTRDLE